MYDLENFILRVFVFNLINICSIGYRFFVEYEIKLYLCIYGYVFRSK